MGPLGSFLGAVFFGTAAGASAAYVLAVNVARLAIVSLAAKLTAPKINLNQTAAEKLLTVRSTIQPQAFVYGQDMLSGPLIFANTSGSSNEQLHRLVALTGREIDSFVAFRIDDTDIVIGVGIPDDSDTVSGGVYADVVDIDTRKGTSTQTAIAALTAAFPTLWTSNHRCRGWSLLYTRMTLVGENTAFESGIPQNLRALVNGHKVYDPRLDSTNGGTGTHRLNDDTTWAWSLNPALCLADFLRWERVGMGEEDDRIDWPLVAAAADICDELVDVPTSATQKRYTCNLTFFSDQDRGQIQEMIETAMLGRSIFSQGKWRMWAGAPLAATVTLTEANLGGSIQLQASSGSQERYNRVRGKFIDPSRNYTASSYPEQRNATFESADGEVRYKTIDFNACNNAFEAQRAAIIKLRQSRNQRVLIFEGNWSCFRIQPGKTVAIDIDELGFSGEKFFVTEWVLDKQGKGVNLTMVSENDTDWDDPLEGDYTVRTPTGDLVPPASQAVKISSADIHRQRTGATCTAGFRLRATGELDYSTAAGGWTQAGVPPGEWRRFGGADYWARLTVNSGTLSTGTADTWLPTTSDISATAAQATAGTAVANVTVQLSTDDAGNDIVASGILDLEATYVEPPQVIPLDFTVNDERTDASGINASALVNWVANGGIEGDVDSVVAKIGDWHVDSTYPDPGSVLTPGEDYEVRCSEIISSTAAAGFEFSDFPTGAGADGIGGWVAFKIQGTTTNVWTRNHNQIQGVGVSETVARFQIRDIATETLQAEYVVTFHAEVTP